MNKIDDFHDSIRSNEMICPRPRFCSDPGTFVRSELYKDLKFGGKVNYFFKKKYIFNFITGDNIISIILSVLPMNHRL